MRVLKRMLPRWLKGHLHIVTWPYRRATWYRRPLPDFLIVGSQKAGTTSLHKYISQHPQISPPYRKEVRFYAGGLKPGEINFKKGEAWYRANFSSRKNSNIYPKSFEASTLYMFHPYAPERIFNSVPDAKLIVLLRNPAERAISHYFFSKIKGFENLPLKEALENEEKRLQPILDNNDYSNKSFAAHSYKIRGLYKQQLDRFFNLFSREQVLILCSEDLFGEPEKILKQVYDFVGVDQDFDVKDLKAFNVGSNKSKVDPDIYNYLNDYFEPHNKELYKLVGRDFGW